jgi:CHASE2 domain-containing sensor protein
MTRKKSFWKSYWTRHFPVSLAITAVVVALEVIGLLVGPELWILDHTLLSSRSPYTEIHLVEINNLDYIKWFDSKSPLKPEVILGLIEAVRARRPRVIGLDIDTRDWGPLESIPCTVANRTQILFLDVPKVETEGADSAKAAAPMKEPASEARNAITSGLHCFIQADGPSITWAGIPTNKEEPLELGRVLGQDPEKVIESLGVPPESQTVIGIPRFPEDPDDVVREYRGDYEIKGLGSRMNSLARAVAEQYSPALDVTKQEVLLNYAGNSNGAKYGITDAGVFLQNECVENKSFADRFKVECQGAAPSPLPYLINKIVLIGGAYDAARDTHRTPLGEIPGVEIIAQAIDSDLHGGGIRLLPWPIAALLDLLVATGVVYLYYRLRARPYDAYLLGWGIVLAVVVVCIVLVRFKLAWLNVVPVVVGANLEQLWHHGAELRHAQRKK